MDLRNTRWPSDPDFQKSVRSVQQVDNILAAVLSRLTFYRFLYYCFRFYSIHITFSSIRLHAGNGHRG